MQIGFENGHSGLNKAVCEVYNRQPRKPLDGKKYNSKKSALFDFQATKHVGSFRQTVHRFISTTCPFTAVSVDEASPGTSIGTRFL